MRLRDLFRGPSTPERKSIPSILSTLDINTFLNAALDRETDTLQKYLLAGFAPDQSDPITKTTALHIAVESGNIRAVQVLLQAGAQVNLLDSSSSTPLHVAAYLGYDEIVQVLLNHGADMYKPDNTGRNAFHLVVSTGNQRAIQCFLSEQAIIHHPDAQNWTPLMCACASHQPSTCLFLLSHGADLCSVNDRGQNLLHLAAFLGSTSLIEQIFNLNLDEEMLLRALNQNDARNQTPLFYACLEGHSDIALGFLQAGANPYHLDQENQTCLHAMLSSTVIFKRHVRLFYQLIQLIDYRSYQDNFSRTLLDLAFLNQLNSIISLLILFNYKRNYTILTNPELNENVAVPMLTLGQICILHFKRSLQAKQYNHYDLLEHAFQQTFHLNFSREPNDSHEVVHRKSFDDLTLSNKKSSAKSTTKKSSWRPFSPQNNDLEQQQTTQSTWSIFTNKFKSMKLTTNCSLISSHPTTDFHPMKNLALAILLSPSKLHQLLDFPSLNNNPLFDDDMKTMLSLYNLQGTDFSNQI